MNRSRAIVKITKTIKAHNSGNYKTKKGSTCMNILAKPTFLIQTTPLKC